MAISLHSDTVCPISPITSETWLIFEVISLVALAVKFKKLEHRKESESHRKYYLNDTPK